MLRSQEVYICGIVLVCRICTTNYLPHITFAKAAQWICGHSHISDPASLHWDTVVLNSRMRQNRGCLCTFPSTSSSLKMPLFFRRKGHKVAFKKSEGTGNVYCPLRKEKAEPRPSSTSGPQTLHPPILLQGEMPCSTGARTVVPNVFVQAAFSLAQHIRELMWRGWGGNIL